MAEKPPVKEVGYLHRRTNDYGKVPGELMRDKTVSHGAVRLYAYMHWRYGNNMQNFEGQESMASALGVTPRTIRNWIAELEAKRWVIAIERKDKRSRHLSNRYHIFEVPEECDEWRKRLRLGKPDAVADKKPRTGTGGKPTHKEPAPVIGEESTPHEPKEAPDTSGTQFPMDQRNSVSYGPAESHRNSSSDYPVTSYPVTLIYRGGATETEPLDVAGRFRAIQATLVEKSFDGNGAQFGPAGDLAHLLLGTAEKKHLVEYNLTQPFTLAEFRAFELWYDGKRDKSGQPLHWPVNPAKLNQQVYKFRTSAEYRRFVAKVTTPPALDAPSDSEMAMAHALDALEDTGERDEADTLAA